MHIDATLQAMIDQSSGQGAASTDKPSHSSAQSASNASAGFKGSYASTFPGAAPYPDTVEEPSATNHGTSSSCTADTATFDGSVEQEADPKAPTIRWKAKNTTEAKLYVRQMHRRIPAWKLKLCVEALNTRPINLARIAEVTEIQFETDDLVDVAAQCLVDIAKEMESADKSTGVASAATAAPSQSMQGSATSEFKVVCRRWRAGFQDQGSQLRLVKS